MLLHHRCVAQHVTFGARSRLRPARPIRRNDSAGRVSPAAAAKNLYELLAVPTNAIVTDIKVAYRSLAALYHPDVNKTDTAKHKYQAIQLAYEVLSDTRLRQQYDTHGLAVLGSKYSYLSNFLDTGGDEGSPAPGERGRDLYTVVGLDLEEVVTGAEKVVAVAAMGRCSSCKGSGTQRDGAREACEVCRGSGEILRSRRCAASGMRLTELGVCPACGGKGASFLEFCARCGGEGRARTQRAIKIRVPAGVDGSRLLVLKEQGDAGRFGGPPGDLYVKFEVYLQDNFERRGDDLYSELPLEVYDVLLGITVTVPTARGSRSLMVPPGTQHGSLIKMEHAGVPRVVSGTVSRGHHFFKVNVAIPDGGAADKLQRELLLRLAELQQQAAMSRQQQQQQQPAYATAFGLRDKTDDDSDG